MTKKVVFALILLAALGFILFLILIITRDSYSCDFENSEEAVLIAKRELMLDSRWKEKYANVNLSKANLVGVDYSGVEKTATVDFYVDRAGDPVARVFFTSSCLGQIEINDAAR